MKLLKKLILFVPMPIISIVKKYSSILMYIAVFAPFVLSYKNGDSIDTDFVLFYSVCTNLIFAFYSFILTSYNNRGILFFAIKTHNNKNYLEITNVGGYPIYNIHISLHIKDYGELNVEETNLHLPLNPKSRLNLRQNDTLHKELSESLRFQEIYITGHYTTKGGYQKIKEVISSTDDSLYSNLQ